MNVARKGLILTLVSLLSLFLLTGCDDDDPTSPEDKYTPTPMPSPTPIPPTPTPNGSWGFVGGHAKILVEGLPDNPVTEKESIFCFHQPDTGAWMNVRHRSGNKFQIKGALDDEYGCGDEWHIYSAVEAANGEWLVDWDETGRITVVSPVGTSETLVMTNGLAAWREIRDGYCDNNNLPYSSPSTITVLEFTGVTGTPQNCRE